MQFDVLITGAGCGGSLLAWLLQESGLNVCLADRARHPRFAIGESGTPLADACLRRLAQRLQHRGLEALSTYGSWKQEHPGLTCGLKRGFSYFNQVVDDADGVGSRLIVAASEEDRVGDTHWLRQDTDLWFVRRAAESGVTVIEGWDYQLTRITSGWMLQGADGDREARGRFLVDATGSRQGVMRLCGVPEVTGRLKTESYAAYGHVSGLRRYAELLGEQGADLSRRGFDPDAAAVHHVMRDGWMWQLPFDDGTVSVGRLWQKRSGLERIRNAPEEAASIAADSGKLASQFREAQICRPAKQWVTTGRLQKLFARAAGAAWAALPATVGFVDPLHSKGLALTLRAVEVLADWIPLALNQEEAGLFGLRCYSEELIRDLLWMDELISGCYDELPDFHGFTLWAHLYFLAATCAEQTVSSGFLLSGDSGFREAVGKVCRLLQETRGEPRPCAWQDCRHPLIRSVADILAPWNSVGLFDATTDGICLRTAAPRPSLTLFDEISAP